jgi:tetratricopeptide (TPR) repeat protein
LASGIGLVEEALPQLEAPDEVIRAHSALAAGYRTLAYVFARPDSAEQERAEETLRGHHKKLVELRPSDESALFEYAELLDDRGAAAVLWRKAIEMDPMFLPARLSLGMHLVESGAAEEGLAELRFAFEKAEGADVRRYALRLADALYQLGRHAEAEELRVAFKR